MNPPMTKKCKQCECIKSINEFYRCKKWLQTKCKPCHNVARNNYKRKPYIPVVKKPTGFNKLSLDKRMSIIKDIQDGKKSSEIANSYGVLVDTFRLWKRKGLIKLNDNDNIKENV